MNKTELIKAIAGKVELSAKDVTAVVDAYADVIADALKAGDKVAVAGFGTYELKKKAERSGFNPIKKEVIVIPASNAPVLKFGKAFKDMFNTTPFVRRFRLLTVCAGDRRRTRRAGISAIYPRRRRFEADFSHFCPEIVIFATIPRFCTDFFMRARIYNRGAVC